MMSSGLTVGDRTNLLYLERFLDAADYQGYYGLQFVLMHDNARIYTVRVVRIFLEENEINVLPWPAQSPDLSPMEYLWDTF